MYPLREITATVKLTYRLGVIVSVDNCVLLYCTKLARLQPLWYSVYRNFVSPSISYEYSLYLSDKLCSQ